MSRLVDLTGQRFGRWLVVGRGTPTHKRYKPRPWACICECGRSAEVPGDNLKNGRSRSCGCLRREAITIHGGSGTPAYRSWSGMLHRCYKTTNIGWENYGGRGIKVDKRWHDFSNFLADMGERPPGKSLDRIDVNGNYGPGNCRWADASEQSSNQRKKITNNEKDKLLKTTGKMFSLVLRLRAELRKYHLADLVYGER